MFMSKKTITYIFILLMAIFFLIAIGFYIKQKEQKPVSVSAVPQAMERIKVVTTFLPIYIFSKNVAEDLAVVENLLPADIGPHDYSFTPSDIIKISQADLLVKNGAGLDDWLDEIVDSAGRRDLSVINSSRDISLLKEKHEEEGVNPHFWLNPMLAIKQVENIRDGLIQVDPQNKEDYMANAAKYINKLRVLDKEVRELTENLPNKSFVAFHAAFDYFAKQYGLSQEAVIEEFPGREPSPRVLINLINLVKEKEIKALFSEPQFSPRIIETLSKDLDLPHYVLDPIVTGELKKDFYEIKMRENLQVFKDALGSD